MRRLMHVLAAAVLTTQVLGCSTAPARVPVQAEPQRVLQTAECALVGRVDDNHLPPRFESKPYGWAQVRVDVEQGVVVKAEVLESSPSKQFDAETITLFKSLRFPSLATAHGCVWHHNWG